MSSGPSINTKWCLYYRIDDDDEWKESYLKYNNLDVALRELRYKRANAGKAISYKLMKYITSVVDTHY